MEEKIEKTKGSYSLLVIIKFFGHYGKGRDFILFASSQYCAKETVK
uniref:Uncharacterized protein n=1 Tax=Nelumbo nucifera TaxID=4432 RepID=A0A822ZVP2_NELNU|nr:TPA_asm: hypothetical protein HUJ06_017538 [Nelumbo nucifera]